MKSRIEYSQIAPERAEALCGLEKYTKHSAQQRLFECTDAGNLSK